MMVMVMMTVMMMMVMIAMRILLITYYVSLSPIMCPLLSGTVIGSGPYVDSSDAR